MNTSVNTLYSEYKGGQAIAYCHERRCTSRFVQNKLQKAGYEAKTRSGTRTPTLRRPNEENFKQ